MKPGQTRKNIAQRRRRMAFASAGFILVGMAFILISEMGAGRL